MNLLYAYKINKMEGLIHKKKSQKMQQKVCIILTFLSWLICIFKRPLYFSVCLATATCLII